MAAKDDPRFKYITKIVAGQLSSTGATVTPAMVDAGSNATWVMQFFAAGEAGVDPLMALLFYLQPPASNPKAPPEVLMVDPGVEPLTGVCCYCVRLSDPMQPLPTKDFEDCVNFGMINDNGNKLNSLLKMTSEIFSPLISKNNFAFQKKMSADNVDALKQATDGFCSTLSMVRRVPLRSRGYRATAACRLAATFTRVLSAHHPCRSHFACLRALSAVDRCARIGCGATHDL